MIEGGAARVASRTAACVFAVAAVGMLWQVAAHVTQPGDFVVKHLVLDDAVYYAVPARKFVDGLGYSFDGIHRTNGVQPLWAAVVTLLAFFVRDDVTLLRTTAAVSGTLWLTAGVLLYRFLSPYGALAGIAAIGFLTAGVEVRLGLSGMENGLQSTLLVLLLHAWRRLEAAPPADPEWRRRTLHCGLLLIALCLNRVEFPVLAMPFGLRALWLRLRVEPRTQALRSLVPLVLPPVVAVATWGVISRLYFGDWTPVSGSVKAHMTATDPNLRSFGASYLHHTQQVMGLSFLPTALLLLRWCGSALSLSADATIGVLGTVLGLPIVAAIAPAVRAVRSGLSTLRHWPVLLLLCAALLHLVLVAKYLEKFTSYCTWYFAVDILAVWAVLGIALGAAKGVVGRLLCVPAAALVVVTGAERLVFGGAPPDYPLSATGNYVEAGRWVQRWLPPGRRLGAFNAGFISFHAKSHQVVNLDGLMNDGTYLREYFAKNRVDEYIRHEGIEYVVDSLPLHLWQSYDAGTSVKLLQGMTPLHFDTNEDSFLTGVLATPEAGNHGAPRAVAHPLAAFHWNAIVRGKHRMVREADLATLTADQQVVSTVLEPGSRAMLHFVADRATSRAALDLTGFSNLPTTNATFGGKVTLVAAETPVTPVRRGSTVLVRTYWRAEELSATDGLRLCLLVGTPGVAGGVVETVHAPAFGTLPSGEWLRGTVVAQAFSVRIPDDAAGPLPVAVVVRDDAGRTLTPSVVTPGPAVRVGAIEVAAR